MKELISQAIQNDEQAISQLMGMVGQKSKYIALGYVKNDGDKADDIVQEAFIKAFSSLDSLENPERFEPWFYTILNRVAINHTRVKLIDKESSHFSELDYEETNFEESIDDDYIEFQPKESFDYSELKSGMQEVLEELPFAQKEAVYMYYFEGLNAREIANLFETTEETIRSRLRYAKVKMKEKIEAMEVQGKSLRGIAPVPFLVWMLNMESEGTIPSKLTVTSISTAMGSTPPSLVGKEVASAVVKQTVSSTAGSVSVAGINVSSKALAAITAVIIGFGTIGTVVTVQHQNEVRQEIIAQHQVEPEVKSVNIETANSDNAKEEQEKARLEEEKYALEEQKQIAEEQARIAQEQAAKKQFPSGVYITHGLGVASAEVNSDGSGVFTIGVGSHIWSYYMTGISCDNGVCSYSLSVKTESRDGPGGHSMAFINTNTGTLSWQ